MSQNHILIIQCPQISYTLRTQLLNKNFINRVLIFTRIYILQSMIPENPNVIKNMQQFYREVKGKWKSLYPAYFNSNKSIAQGRRVAKQLAIPDPTIEQISTAVGMCRIKNIIQPHKAYSRDILQRGRLKAEVFDKQGKPIHSEINSKKKFIIAVAKRLKENRANHPKK